MRRIYGRSNFRSEGKNKAIDFALTKWTGERKWISNGTCPIPSGYDLTFIDRNCAEIPQIIAMDL